MGGGCFDPAGIPETTPIEIREASGMGVKKILFVLLLTAGVLLICLFAFEGFIRLFYRAEILGSKMPLVYQHHEKLGHTFRPGAVGFMSRHGEIFSEVRINASGFRDFDYPAQKPAGIFRIAMIGDSFVTGNHLALEKTFPKVMEKKFRKNQGLKIEVLNFGVDGFGPREERLLFDLAVKAFQPDLVVQCIFPFNDVDDVKKGRFFRVEYRGAVLKYQTGAQLASLKSDRNLELEQEAESRTGHPVLSYLRKKLWLIRFIEGRRLRPIRDMPEKVHMLNQWEIPEIDRHPGDMSPPFKKALDETQSLILALQEQVESAGAGFALIIIPADLEVSLKEWNTRPFTLSAGLFKNAMHRGCLIFERKKTCRH